MAVTPRTVVQRMVGQVIFVDAHSKLELNCMFHLFNFFSSPRASNGTLDGVIELVCPEI